MHCISLNKDPNFLKCTTQCPFYETDYLFLKHYGVFVLMYGVSVLMHIVSQPIHGVSVLMHGHLPQSAKLLAIKASTNSSYINTECPFLIPNSMMSVLRVLWPQRLSIFKLYVRRQVRTIREITCKYSIRCPYELDITYTEGPLKTSGKETNQRQKLRTSTGDGYYF